MSLQKVEIGRLQNSHSEMATKKTIALQLSKQWIPNVNPALMSTLFNLNLAVTLHLHFFLSLRWPPTSNNLYVKSPITKLVSLIPVVLTRARRMSWSVGVKLVAAIRAIELK